MLKALLDTGTSMSIVSESRINNRVKTSNRTEWNTTAGKFVTTGKSTLSMKLLELSSSTTVNHIFHVHNSKLCHLQYDHR